MGFRSLKKGLGLGNKRVNVSPEPIINNPRDLWGSLSGTERKDLLINNPDILTPQGGQTYDPYTNTITLKESDFTRNQRLDQERLAMELSRSLSGNLPATDNEAVRNATFELGKRQLEPELKSQREALAKRLVNQGIPIGSQAYNSEMNRFEKVQGEQLNALSLQSLLQGIQTAEAQRQARFNEISSLLGRSQVGSGVSFGEMQGRYQGLDIMGARQAELNRASAERMQNSLMRNQQRAQMWQAAGSLAGTAIKSFFGGRAGGAGGAGGAGA